MHGSAQDAWFYSREGERFGPVAFSDLQAKAKEKELNPRLDLVWSEGMDGWKPAGEIDGLFERRTAAGDIEGSAPPPLPEVMQQPATASPAWPGIGRGTFITASIVFPVAWGFGFQAAAPFIAKELGPELMKIAAIVAVAIPFLMLVFFNISRLANLAMSWLVWVAIVLMFAGLVAALSGAASSPELEESLRKILGPDFQLPAQP